MFKKPSLYRDVPTFATGDACVSKDRDCEDCYFNDRKQIEERCSDHEAEYLSHRLAESEARVRELELVIGMMSSRLCSLAGTTSMLRLRR